MKQSLPADVPWCWVLASRMCWTALVLTRPYCNCRLLRRFRCTANVVPPASYIQFDWYPFQTLFSDGYCVGDGCHVGNLPIVRPFQFGSAPWPLFNSCSFQQSMSTISSQELRLPKESIGGHIELSEKDLNRTILRKRRISNQVYFGAKRNFFYFGVADMY